MEIRIEGHDLPGRDLSCDGVSHGAAGITATVALSDGKGHPRCARVRPPAIEWRRTAR